MYKYVFLLELYVYIYVSLLFKLGLGAPEMDSRPSMSSPFSCSKHPPVGGPGVGGAMSTQHGRSVQANMASGSRLAKV